MSINKIFDGLAWRTMHAIVFELFSCKLMPLRLQLFKTETFASQALTDFHQIFLANRRVLGSPLG